LRRVKTLRKGAYRRATGQIVTPICGRARDEISLNFIGEPKDRPWYVPRLDPGEGPRAIRVSERISRSGKPSFT
jgi:hypothetical protein